MPFFGKGHCHVMNGVPKGMDVEHHLCHLQRGVWGLTPTWEPEPAEHPWKHIPEGATALGRHCLPIPSGPRVRDAPGDQMYWGLDTPI